MGINFLQWRGAAVFWYLYVILLFNLKTAYIANFFFSFFPLIQSDLVEKMCDMGIDLVRNTRLEAITDKIGLDTFTTSLRDSLLQHLIILIILNINYSNNISTTMSH